MSPKEAAQLAARERAALRLGDLTDEEREGMLAELDYLAPYRFLVLGLGAVFFLAGLSETFFSLVQARRMDSDLVSLVLFEAFGGAILLYAGNVWMAPPPLPTMEELLSDSAADLDGVEEDDKLEKDDAKPKKRGSMIGTWSYWLIKTQSFVIDRDEGGTWTFCETVGDQTYTGVLQPNSRWLIGAVYDDETGQCTGRIRLRPGPDDTVLSNFQMFGTREWSGDLRASLVSRPNKETTLETV